MPFMEKLRPGDTSSGLLNRGNRELRIAMIRATILEMQNLCRL